MANRQAGGSGSPRGGWQVRRGAIDVFRAWRHARDLRLGTAPGAPRVGVQGPSENTPLGGDALNRRAAYITFTRSA